MDERKKAIKDILDAKQGELNAAGLLYEDLGKLLLSRFGSSMTLPSKNPEFEEKQKSYNELRQKQEGYGDLLGTVEDKVQALNQIEEELRQISEDSASRSAGLKEVFSQIGEEVMETDFADPNREKVEDSQRRLADLETDLDAIAGKKRTNIVNWFGNEARTLILRTSIKKQQDAQKKLYGELGEIYYHSPGKGDQSAKMKKLLGSALESIQLLKELDIKSGALKNEQQQIWELYGKNGSPARKIIMLEKSIADTNKEIQLLCKNLGELAAESPKKFSNLMGEEEKILLERINAIKTSMSAADNEIMVLDAAIKADRERKAIDKWQTEIDIRKLRIKNAEYEIDEFAGRIEEAQKRIEELESIGEGKRFNHESKKTKKQSGKKAGKNEREG